MTTPYDTLRDRRILVELTEDGLWLRTTHTDSDTGKDDGSPTWTKFSMAQARQLGWELVEATLEDEAQDEVEVMDAEVFYEAT
jgi:hypothetical protein